MTQPSDFNQILPKVARLGLIDYPEPIHLSEAWARIELEARWDDLKEAMNALPQMVPSLRQELEDALGEALEGLQRGFDALAVLDEFVETMEDVAKDPGGRFAQEAEAMARALNRAEGLAHQLGVAPRSSRRRS